MFSYHHSIRNSVQLQVENEIDVGLQQNGRLPKGRQQYNSIAISKTGENTSVGEVRYS